MKLLGIVLRFSKFINRVKKSKSRGFNYEVQHGLEVHETPGWVS